VTTTVAAQAAPSDGAFRRRLLDGLAASIDERGYRDTTVADIVRHARTSKRTFYDQFSAKETCFAELLTANAEEIVTRVRGAVDPDAPWRDQVRQAVAAYLATIEARTALTLSWIRELPALGESARPTLRRGFGRLVAMIVELSGNNSFQEAGIPPISRAAAVILVGGLRELTAQTMEDGDPVTDIIEPAVAVATAILGPKTTS
jgi:AcrR family transcriptional regulator